jgi:hypothetical protein
VYKAIGQLRELIMAFVKINNNIKVVRGYEGEERQRTGIKTIIFLVFINEKLENKRKLLLYLAVSHF